MVFLGAQGLHPLLALRPHPHCLCVCISGLLSRRTPINPRCALGDPDLRTWEWGRHEDMRQTDTWTRMGAQILGPRVGCRWGGAPWVPPRRFWWGQSAPEPHCAAGGGTDPPHTGTGRPSPGSTLTPWALLTGGAPAQPMRHPGVPPTPLYLNSLQGKEGAKRSCL